MTSLTGSALLALAVDFGELDAETAWNAAHVDEDFQAEHWGRDAEALARRTNRKRDMIAAAELIEAIRSLTATSPHFFLLTFHLLEPLQPSSECGLQEIEMRRISTG